jgi:hypothetical protein
MNTITLQEVIKDFGKQFADKALAYCRHHTDQNGQPFWTEEELNDICGLIELEDESEDQG